MRIELSRSALFLVHVFEEVETNWLVTCAQFKLWLVTSTEPCKAAKMTRLALLSSTIDVAF